MRFLNWSEVDPVVFRDGRGLQQPRSLRPASAAFGSASCSPSATARSSSAADRSYRGRDAATARSSRRDERRPTRMRVRRAVSRLPAPARERAGGMRVATRTRPLDRCRKIPAKSRGRNWRRTSANRGWGSYLTLLVVRTSPVNRGSGPTRTRTPGPGRQHPALALGRDDGAVPRISFFYGIVIAMY